MALFFVGQRVRVVGCAHPENRHLIGMEARIIDLWPEGAVLDINHLAARGSWIRFDYIEPILPSSHKPSEYANVHDLLDAMKRKQANPDEVAA